MLFIMRDMGNPGGRNLGYLPSVTSSSNPGRPDKKYQKQTKLKRSKGFCH